MGDVSALPAGGRRPRLVSRRLDSAPRRQLSRRLPADAVFPYWIIGLALPSDMLMTKAVAAPAAAFLGVLLFDRQALTRLRPVWLDAPVVLWCLWPAVAAAFADEPRPGPLLAIGYLAAAWGLPWLLGRVYFASAEGRLLLVKGLVLSALACLPVQAWSKARSVRSTYDAVYETHPFRADGAARYLGFRPIGFFEHGNQFGLWISLSALAALWLAISSRAARWRWAAAISGGDGAGCAVGRRHRAAGARRGRR